MQDIDSLNRHFSIPGHISFTEGMGGLPVAKTHNSQASAEIALQGAHLFHWQPHGEAPVIWLSSGARFTRGKAIRGGIPICWPWFGIHEDPTQTPHGFARTAMWQVSTTEALADGGTRIQFSLTNHESIPAIWPYAFQLDYTVTVGSALVIELTTRNMDSRAFRISEALHTYFVAGDIEKTLIHGLTGHVYVDKADGMQRKSDHETISIKAEIDRVYLNTQDRCSIEDRELQRTIEITSTHARSTTVWNPWREKSDAMGDMGNHGYRTMICVENCNALDNAVTIQPGQHHSLIARYEVRR